PESKLIDEIFKEVLDWLDDTFQTENNKHLVGIESCIEEIESLLGVGSTMNICKLGISGSGDIGKTTIAGAIFNKITRRFEEFPNIGLNFQSKMLTRKKLLIVFDDVHHPRQIDCLIECLDWFASASRIIIISRDEQELISCGVNKIYQMQELVHADALN
ncbi:hypothetical protein CUMW_183820, partial [Citrus unshiu]